MPYSIYSENNQSVEIYENGNVVFKHARVLFRNFAGKASKYNAEGKRNFCLVIPDKSAADKLSENGWHVRILAPRDEFDEATYYIPVAVNFTYKPPRIETAQNGVITPIDESMISMLDSADFRYVDAVINPYSWNMGTNSGVKAYLKSMRIFLETDELDALYADDAPFDE